MIPSAVVTSEALAGRYTKIVDWTGYGATSQVWHQQRLRLGIFNAMTEPDGAVRALPLLAHYQSQ